MYNYQIFKETTQVDNDQIVFGIIDKIDQAANEWSKSVTKNITDYTLQEITREGYTVVVSVDEETILTYLASTNFKYVVMITTGTEFVFDPTVPNNSTINENGDTFLEISKHFCLNNNFFLAGHILDRGESYYELHEQCYILNLETYKELGCPKIGKVEYQCQHEQTEPIRSINSIHNNYTPLYVNNGNKKRNYVNKCHGWNIISVALDNNLKIEVFSNKLRVNKKHYYPAHENTFTKEINFVYDRFEFSCSTAISPFNSENFTTTEFFKSPIEQLIVPASGLNWIKHLEEYKFQKGTVVKFYDFSLPALEFMHKLTTWNGDDYPTFVNQFFSEKINFLNNREKILVCGPKDVNKAWDKFKSSINFYDTWNKIRENVTFEFHHKNLLNSSVSLNWIDANKNTIMSLSNIFNYSGTAPFYSLKTRLLAENKLLENLKEINPNLYVYFNRRSAGGYCDNQTNVFAKVSDIKLINVENLQKPSWHSNKDWSESST